MRFEGQVLFVLRLVGMTGVVMQGQVVDDAHGRLFQSMFQKMRDQTGKFEQFDPVCTGEQQT